MNIKGLDYNTQREQLLLPEYGREIQRMVEYAVSLPTKAQRQHCATTIVRMMATKAPQLQVEGGHEQTLWDHLYLMSHKQLDIDWPFDVTGAEKLMAKPEPLPLPGNSIRHRHYGRLLEEVFEQLKTMPDGPARNELIRQAANQMKRDLMTWGHGAMENEKVADDLARLTDGAVQLDLDKFKFEKVSSVKEEPRKGKKRK